jgi:hypothetical protein
MKLTGLVVALFVLGCTKPNPNVCCTDAADCSAKGIPVGSICDEGLVCRGNQCISQPCGGASDCDAAAPYCVAELCAEQCNDDTQCPGAMQDSSSIYCVAGGCATCRTSADCSASAPVCDGGECRSCTAHTECDSQICRSGQCVALTQIAYAAPTGSMTSACTKTEPCTIQRAWNVTDATRNVVKLLPGTYSLSADLVFRGGYQLDVYGEATVSGTLSLINDAMATLKLNEVTVNGSLICAAGSAAVPIPHLELEKVSVTSGDLADAINATNCIVQVRQSTVRAGASNSRALYALGGGGSGGQLATVERSTLIAASNGFDVAIYVEGFASLRMINSIVRGGSSTNGAIGFGTNVGASSVSFSTFYNNFLKCPTGNMIVASSNNIFLNESVAAPTNTLTGTACVHNRVLAKPQSTAPTGANNIINADPRFTNGAGGDFHLMAGSPAIDAADPASTEATDFDGTARPQGAARDMGAFEYH